MTLRGVQKLNVNLVVGRMRHKLVPETSQMRDAKSRGHIAVLLPDLRSGGAERLHVNLAREWQQRGMHVEFVLRHARGELLSLLPQGTAVTDLQVDRVRSLLFPLASYLRTARPDVLLAAMWPLTVVAPLAARLARFRGRVVVSEHSPLSLAYSHRGWMHRRVLRASQRLCYPLADARVAVSAGVADDLAQLSGLERSRFDVIHNPAALGRAHERTVVPTTLEGVRRPLILSVGRLKQVKRYDLLIDAFAQLPAETGGTLCILGDGPERAALEQQVRELRLEGRVLLPGFAADPAPWYAQADLFVLSSDYEGFGNVIVEAMEFGVPVVSTNCVAGPAEILCDGRFGRLVSPGDAIALATAMREALQAPVDRDALRARASDFAVDRLADCYLDVLLPGWRKEAQA